METRELTIRVPVLARVEGEGALDIQIRDARIESIKLSIFEPPRLFEKLLEGRHYTEVPDIVARICGICPVAYQMSAVHALESLFECEVSEWVNAMRRVYYCGEWIESHALHVHLLAAPDYLGYDSAPAMARDYPQEVKRGLSLQRLGNDLIKLFGARSVNPIGAVVGGFAHAPSVREVRELVVRLSQAESEARDLVRWTASLAQSSNSQSFVSVAMHAADEYPMNRGEIISSAGLAISAHEFTAHFEESQVPHSTALHCLLHGEPYLVGPLARVNLNLAQLHEPVRAVLRESGIAFPSNNTAHSMVARAAEIYYAVIEAKQQLLNYLVPSSASTVVTPRAGVAYGCSEAPRGVLWHRYEIDNEGLVRSARIVPPTSQNQARIEQDIKLTLERGGLDAPENELRVSAERVIRHYDPCISCATHFLDLRVTRL